MENYHNLAELSNHAAIEIDNYLKKKKTGLSSVKEFTKIIQDNLISDSDTFLTMPDFPYLALAKAMRKDSNKEIRYVSELALEMRLFYSELSDLEGLSKDRLENLRNFCVEASKSFLAERLDYLRKVA